MRTDIRHTVVLVLGCVLLAVVMACGGTPEPAVDIEATVQARLTEERAIEDWDEAIRLDPQDADAYNNRGIAYHDLGEYQRAIEDYDEAIRLNPQAAYAYYNRGLAYERLGRQEQADRDFAKAKELGVE